MDTEALKAESTLTFGASAVGDMTKEKRMQLILDKVEANGTFKHQEAEWERRRKSDKDRRRVENNFSVYNAGLYGSVMLTMFIRVKTLTNSVAVARLDNHRGTKADQGTWKCGLPAEFIDVDQMSVQELMASKRMPHATIDGIPVR
jgi:hypothetical protein